MVDPATRTIERCRAGWRKNARASSSGSSSSSSVIPTIFTKPPAGMAFTPYSVSPRRNDQMRRAEADEVLRRLHAEALGGGQVAQLVERDRRTGSRTRRRSHPGPSQLTPVLVVAGVEPPASSWARCRAQVSASRTSARLNGFPIGRSASSWMCSSTTAATVSTISGKRSRPAMNAGDRLLVGGVEHAGRRAAGLASPPGEPDRREGVGVEGLERPGSGRGSSPSAPGRPARDPASRARGRSAAACPAGTPERACEPSCELDHRVDQRLRVDDDVDPVVGQVEEQVRLDQLQPLVDQRRGVDGDHRSHAPRSGAPARRRR